MITSLLQQAQILINTIVTTFAIPLKEDHGGIETVNGKVTHSTLTYIWSWNDSHYIINSWDGKLHFGFNDCSSAITMIVAIDDNHKEGRKFWVYASVVDGGNPRNYQRNFFINSRDG